MFSDDQFDPFDPGARQGITLRLNYEERCSGALPAGPDRGGHTIPGDYDRRREISPAC